MSTPTPTPTLPPAKAQPQKIAEITITVFDTGGVAVSGAIGDLFVAYGILEAGKDAIRDHHKRLSSGKSRLLVPPNV